MRQAAPAYPLGDCNLILARRRLAREIEPLRIIDRFDIDP